MSTVRIRLSLQRLAITYWCRIPQSVLILVELMLATESEIFSDRHAPRYRTHGVLDHRIVGVLVPVDHSSLFKVDSRSAIIVLYKINIRPCSEQYCSPIADTGAMDLGPCRNPLKVLRSLTILCHR
jgi:hypothetical protein